MAGLTKSSPQIAYTLAIDHTLDYCKSRLNHSLLKWGQSHFQFPLHTQHHSTDTRPTTDMTITTRSASEFIYEMHYHDARPDSSDAYIEKYEKYSKEITDKTKNKAELVASFRVEIGNQDQFIHIWRYHDGYKQASNLHNLIKTDETLIKINREQMKDLVKRESQFMMSFSFWDHPKPQQHNCFYEMRSYTLKPGTMIEWANGWSKGIKHRDNAVAGFFSQIGQLYTVHHIWRYEDLQVRKDVRENAWRRPGWDECVAITVPNIVYLHSRWMAPNKFSPIR